ncbi:unnamed protein product [Prorocentrum cordatum]|uniref:Uncharacterized protein n=1 Tax=Prorocentrum cordatum TaxID=2364126 RepID=A0ABN9UN74_9DINO|nr:unnamed protein product [Polarella glacialis]
MAQPYPTPTALFVPDAQPSAVVRAQLLRPMVEARPAAGVVGGGRGGGGAFKIDVGQRERRPRRLAAKRGLDQTSPWKAAGVVSELRIVDAVPSLPDEALGRPGQEVVAAAVDAVGLAGLSLLRFSGRFVEAQWRDPGNCWG